MPKITLLKDRVKFPGGHEIDVSTLDLINTAWELGPKEGLDMKTVRARLRLHKAIDELTPESIYLDLDNEDYATLQRAVEPLRFNGINNVVKTFVEDLSVEPVEIPKKLKSVK